MILTSFAGGYGAPMMLGKSPVLVTNDAILPVCFILWYLTHYLGFQSIFMFPPIQLVSNMYIILTYLY